MARLLQQPVIQQPHAVNLPKRVLKVNVRLPQHLGHVQKRLRDGQLVDGPRTLLVAQHRLELGIAHPCLAVGRVELEVLVVQRAAPVKLTQLRVAGGSGGGRAREREREVERERERSRERVCVCE